MPKYLHRPVLIEAKIKICHIQMLLEWWDLRINISDVPYLVVVIFFSSTSILTVFAAGLTGDFCCFSLFLIGVRFRVAVLEGVTSNPIALNLFSKSVDSKTAIKCTCTISRTTREVSF